MRFPHVTAAVLACLACSTLGAQPQCSMQDVVGKWAYNYSGWYIPAAGSAPVQISTHGVFVIDWSGKVTGPGTWAMGAAMAGTPIQAGQMLEFDFVSGTIQVTADCTGLLMTYLKFKTLPVPPMGPYYGRIIVIPGRDEIEGMALQAPNTEKPMWTYTLKRISYLPGTVEWLIPPSK